MTVDLNHLKNYKALTKFIDFIKSLPFVTNEQIIILNSINETIVSGAFINTKKHWDISLDIFDTAIQNRLTTRKGIYWRSWGVYIEPDHFLVECKSRCEPDEFEHGQFEFCYTYWFDTKKEFYFPREHNAIELFFEDAANYQQYVTAFLNTIEVDVFLINESL